MAHPFEISVRELTSAPSKISFQSFCSELLKIEAAEFGMSVRTVEASTLETVADGGVDTVSHLSDESRSEWIPAGVGVWQFKEGKAPPSELEKDGIGGEVQAQLSKGGTYTLVAGTPLTPSMKSRRRKKLECLFDRHGLDCRVQVMGADEIATWANTRPAALALFGRNRNGFHFVNHWLDRQERHHVPYEWAEATESVRDELRRRVQHAAGPVHLHVWGRPGVGKTRLVLESFKDKELGAIYRDTVGNIDPSLLDLLIERSDMSCLLIIDECSAAEARHLKRQLQMARGQIRLITIGAEPMSDPEDQFEVDRMPDDIIRAIVRGVSSAIPLQIEIWITDKVGGYVKLAHALAQRAAKSNVNLSILDLGALLKEMIPDDTQRRALTVLALLSHVGWDDDLEDEGRALSKHMELGWRECRRLIDEAEDEGYVGRAGRYRYVTPDLLAIWLAGREWSANRAGLLRIWSEEIPGADERFKRRLGQLNGVPEVAGFAKEVLGPDGPFRTLAILNQERAARLLGELSRIDSEAAVRALERLVGTSESEELLAFTAGRREIMWTLERLVAYQKLFPASARLILRLAVAENEYYANNATGTFQALFSPRGGATAAPGDERVELLAEIVERGDVPELLVTIGALKQVFEVHSGHAVSADPSGIAPPTYWAARTLEDHVEYCGRAFVLLETLLDHEVEEVRSAAESVVLERFRNFFWLGLSEHALTFVQRSDLSESVRRRLPLEADDIIQFDGDKWFMTEELASRLRAMPRMIFGDPLRERLHLRLGSWSSDLRRSAQDSSESFLEAQSREFAELASELLAQPEILRDEFKWIVSEEAVQGRTFLRHVGEVDREREWLSPVLEASLELQRPDLISSYVFGLARSSENAEVEELLDTWATDDALRHLVPNAVASLGLSETGVNRILGLLDKGLAPELLVCLTWSPAHADLSVETLGELLRRMSEAGVGTRGAAVTIAHNALIRNDESEVNSPVTNEILWELAGRSEFIGSFVGGGAAYAWSECAKLLAEEDAERLVEVITEAVLNEHERLFAGSCVRDVLLACFDSDPSRSWAVFAQAIEVTGFGSWSLTSWAAEAGVIDRVGLENLRIWTGASGADHESRVGTIAKLSTVDTDLTPVIRWIVTEYGESEKILGHLMSQYGSRTITGDMAPAEQPRLDAARQWEKDEDPAIRRWARRVVEDLEQRISKYRVEDEESRLRH